MIKAFKCALAGWVIFILAYALLSLSYRMLGLFTPSWVAALGLIAVICLIFAILIGVIEVTRKDEGLK